MYSICIFARNEERTIARCLSSLDAGAENVPFNAHVMINGCTDNTAAIVAAIAEHDPRIKIHQEKVGDKANAWNYYVHDIAPDASLHIFLDGDVTAEPGSFTALARTLKQQPNAYAVAGTPGCGRSRENWTKTLIRQHYLSGNLYALSNACVRRIRELRLSLPFGSKGEDGLLTYLLHTDLIGGPDTSHKYRVAIATDALFHFPSLSLSINDARLYWGRLHRYSERRFEGQILFKMLKSKGISAMPKHVKDIYTGKSVRALKCRTSGVEWVIDQRIKRRLSAGQHYKGPEGRKISKW